MGKLSRELRMGIHNRFDIEVVDVETGEIKQKVQAFNVVCNSYYDRILSSSVDAVNTIVVGTGLGTPAATDTSLFTHLGAASADSAASPYDHIDFSREKDGIWTRQIKRAVLNTQYVGSEITEVGLSKSSSTGNLVTHALLQDMNGNPISIQHTNTDIINIYCTIYLHYEEQNSDTHLYHVSANGQTDATPRMNGIVERALLSFFGSNSGSAPRIRVGGTSIMSSQSSYEEYYSDNVLAQYTVPASISYSSANKRITITGTQFPITSGNFNGIGLIGLLFNNNGQTPSYKDATSCIIECGGLKVPPTTIQAEAVGVGDGSTTKFKTKYNYPYDATVYKNGVAVQSGVTIKRTPCTAITQNSTQPNIINTGGYGVYSGNCYSPSFADAPDIITPVYYRGNYEHLFTKIGRGAAIKMLATEVGIYRIGVANGAIKGSNDGSTWVDVETNTNNAQMPQAGAHYKYYKNVSSTDAVVYMNGFDGYNIIFDNPPAVGDVITIDYTTDYIPKDSDHVLDVELTFTFGEWTGE